MMLPPDRVKQILTLGKAGWSAPAIAAHLGHSQVTVRDYLAGRRTAGVRVQRPGLFTDLIASYCQQRFAEDSHLRPSVLFKEVSELGYTASRATFYRHLTHRRISPASRRELPARQAAEQTPDETPRPIVHMPQHVPVLPRSVTPVAGEALISYLTRLAAANHLTLDEVLAVLPGWFTTKANNPDDRAQHHMLVTATTDALRALANLTSTTPTGLAHALPAFGADKHGPVRATTACHRCVARRGIHQAVPVHRPIHDKVCTRHGIWLSDDGQPLLDVTASPDIIAAQHRANRLLRRYTPQELMLGLQAATKAIPAWPASPRAIPQHWRHRLLTLQTTNRHRGVPTDHAALLNAAIYPNAVTTAAAILNRKRTDEQDPLAKVLERPANERP
jgi:hypothetical protein